MQADLVAVLVAVTGGQPRLLATHNGKALPAGPFTANHRSLQASLRAWVETQTHHPLGFVEQLYTFADRDRSQAEGMRAISISYLALTRELDDAGRAQPGWQDWYRYFPWEDWRAGMPAIVATQIAPALKAWSDSAIDSVAAGARWQRASITFGLDDQAWNEELVLQRYELLFEAGLVHEAWRDGVPAPADAVLLGTAMDNDHRRILATGLGRLRSKLKYRPVLFDLMPATFTLSDLQSAAEAISGLSLHKQNFRRGVERTGLVQPTGVLSSATGGRPAELFRVIDGDLTGGDTLGLPLPAQR